LPAAAVDPASGTIFSVRDDGRYRSDGTNDAVMSRSFDNGLTWTAPQRINPDSTTDHVDHYGVTVAVGSDGAVHVAYRTRDESGQGPNYAPVIDTYYQRSLEGGDTWTAPLKVDNVASNPYYDAFLPRRLVRGRLQRAGLVGRVHVHRPLPGPAGAPCAEPRRLEHAGADRGRQRPPVPEHLGGARS
jgi:hypothetical protein